MHNPNEVEPKKTSKPSVLQMAWSVFAAFCGVQSGSNHDRDEDHIERVGFMPYIIIGVMMTLLFVLAVYAVVQVVLHLAE